MAFGHCNDCIKEARDPRDTDHILPMCVQKFDPGYRNPEADVTLKAGPYSTRQRTFRGSLEIACGSSDAI